MPVSADAGTGADGGFGLYVHWPFCAAKCPYCDFNSHVRRGLEGEPYGSALVREMEHMRARTGPRRLDSVFFGGGTPSLMAPRLVTDVIDAAERLWGLHDGAEITLEANPTSTDAERFAGYRTAGVNRVSIGVQALNDTDLKVLGRLHSVDEARAAIETARAAFPRLSFDLIYARPGQSVAGWSEELRQAIDLAADHLSLYQLTIEPGTPFYDLHARGHLKTPDDDLAADLYEATGEICRAAGLDAYEVSNHARSGAESRHNLVYWRYGDYVGVGPGAHGRITLEGGRVATETIRSPEAWRSAVEADGHGVTTVDALSATDQASEYLVMGLRLREGISLSRFARLAGRPMDEKTLEDLVADDLVAVARDRLTVTGRGRPVLNAVIAALA
ncbi:MAG: radical SAM family heme chaperone HemW [Alphaproteobacteria bacterium]